MNTLTNYPPGVTDTVRAYRDLLGRAARLITDAADLPARSGLTANIARVDEALDLLVQARAELGKFAQLMASSLRAVSA